MAPKSLEIPLIAIVGATGTGKSQLAVSLAHRFNGEVINGDALQIYQGLPTVTNKMPIAERRGIPHHLLGCIKPDEEPWTVTQFVDQASKAIDEIRSRGKLPILVGGTHYYTQSLLFADAVVAANSPQTSSEEISRFWPILNASTEEMLYELQRVDPAMAKRWHPRDQRKIRRSLELYLTKGRKASDVYEQQQQQFRMGEGTDASEGEDNQESGPNRSSQRSAVGTQAHFRYRSLLFWTHAAPNVLNPRLEERVDKMVSAGLLDEVRAMYSLLQTRDQQGDPIDQSRGIWVAIGFKEFLPYIQNPNESTELLKESINRTKIATRQYAKRQIRWIRLRLQRAIQAANAQRYMFLLDATDLQQWPQNVERKAIDITEEFLRGSVLPDPTSVSDAAREALNITDAESMSARYCEACGKTVMSESMWRSHLKSRGHKSAVRPKIDWKALYPKECPS